MNPYFDRPTPKPELDGTHIESAARRHRSRKQNDDSTDAVPEATATLTRGPLFDRTDAECTAAVRPALHLDCADMESAAESTHIQRRRQNDSTSVES